MTAARNNTAKLAGFVFVTEAQYGAKGDGTTDDTAAIQACINANPGRMICFPGGVYRITAPITITANGTRLYGFGRDASILNASASSDAFQFYSLGLTTADFLSNCGFEGFYIFRSVAASAGAGVRLTQCNSFVFTDVAMLNCPEGLKVVGGQLNSLTNFQLFASSAMTDISGVTDTALLSFLEAPCSGGTFQPCYTARVSDFTVSGGLRTQCAVLVGNADGLQVTNGYINLATDSLWRFRNQRNGGYVAGVTISNVYLDCVGNSTDYGMDAPADGFASAFLFNILLSNVYIGGAGTSAIYVRKPIAELTMSGGAIVNIRGDGVDFLGTTGAGSGLHMTGVRLQGTGLGAGATSAVLIDDTAIVNLSGNSFFTHDGSEASIKLTGDLGAVVITGNAIRDSALDFNNATTTIEALTISGNASTATTNRINGGEEGPLTATLTIGGASTGVTYSAQEGHYERVGDVVSFYMTVGLTSKGGLTGTARLAGLPYAPAVNTAASLVVNAMTAGVGDTYLSAYAVGGATTVEMFKMTAGNLVNLTDADLTNTSAIRISGTYRV